MDIDSPRARWKRARQAARNGSAYALATKRLMDFAEHDGEVKGRLPKRKKKHEYAAAFSSLLKRWHK